MNKWVLLYMGWMGFLFSAGPVFSMAVELPVVGSIDAPTETMIWMFVTLTLLKITASGLYAVENYLLRDGRHFMVKGLGYVVKAVRSSLDQIIANTRKVK